MVIGRHYSLARTRHVWKPPITTNFTVGQWVYYVLHPQRNNGPARYMPVEVVNITHKRVVVRASRGAAVRSVLPASLAVRLPTGVVVISG